MFNIFSKKKKKEKLDCLGFYSIKPYDFLGYALLYAKNTLIFENDNVHVYARNHHDTVLIFTLVDNEENIVFEDYTYDRLKTLILEKGIVEGKSVVNIMVYQHNTDQTREIAKKVRVNTKTEINHVLIYNINEVRLEYYRPVPEFYSLYTTYCEAIYFDLDAIDPNKE